MKKKLNLINKLRSIFLEPISLNGIDGINGIDNLNGIDSMDGIEGIDLNMDGMDDVNMNNIEDFLSNDWESKLKRNTLKAIIDDHSNELLFSYFSCRSFHR